MKTRMNFNFKLIVTCLLSLAVIFFAALSFCFTSKTNKANAVNTASAELYLPATDLERHALNSPTGIYHDGKVTAIIENGTTLTIIANGIEKSLTFPQLTEVNLLNDSTLLFATAARLNKLDLATLSDATTNSDAEEFLGSEFTENAVSGFDINDNYLVTAYDTNLMLFSVENAVIEKHPDKITVMRDSHVTINDNNQIFYVNQLGELRYISTQSFGDVTNSTLLTQVNPTAFVADNDYVYYVQSNNSKVYRISIANGRTEELTASDDNYDLGNIVSPASISLYNGNVLITDTALNAVQEFRINGNALEFTGYAIASGKTAYNRVGSNCKDVEKYGNTVAVLDSYKLSVINTKTANAYNRNNFKNYFTSGELGNPNGFALGNGKILAFYGTNTLKFLDLSKDEFETITLAEHDVYDACYQSGKFYVYASIDSSSKIVYEIDENDCNSRKEVFKATVGANVLTVDVFGNVYLASDTTVYFYEKANDYSKNDIKDDRQDIKKILTDLSGTLYLLDKQGLSLLNNGEFEKIELSSPITKDMTSFALDFATSKVYFTYSDEEAVCVSSDLKNLSLENARPTAEFVTSSATADIEDLKIFKPKNGANVYSVTKNENEFTFNGLIESRNEYVYICPITLDNGTSSVTLYAMAGQNETVLVNSLEVDRVNIDIVDCNSEYAYTTTGVNVYYIPLITINTDYSLTVDGTPTRLPSGTQIKTEKIFSFLGREYYYAQIETDGETYSGYIPTAFTVLALSEDFEHENFTYEKVNATTLYLDAEMSSEIATLEDGATVKLYAVNEGVATVAVEIDGVWTVGYINADDIKNEPSKAVRNALIIIAVAACISATTAYFILKKKN